MIVAEIMNELKRIKEQLLNLNLGVYRDSDADSLFMPELNGYDINDIEERSFAKNFFWCRTSIADFVHCIDLMNAPVIAEGIIVRDGEAYYLNGNKLDFESGDLYTIEVLKTGSFWDKNERKELSFWDLCYVKKETGGVYFISSPAVPFLGSKIRIRDFGDFPKFVE